MKRADSYPTTPHLGGSFAPDLSESLSQTLDLTSVELDDLLAAGWTVEQFAQSVASTPPFSEVLALYVRKRLLANR